MTSCAALFVQCTTHSAALPTLVAEPTIAITTIRTKGCISSGESNSTDANFPHRGFAERPAIYCAGGPRLRRAAQQQPSPTRSKSVEYGSGTADGGFSVHAAPLPDDCPKFARHAA